MKIVEQIFISGKISVGSDIAIAVQDAVMKYGTESAKDIRKKYGIDVKPIVKAVETIGVETEHNRLTNKMSQMYVILIIVDMVEYAQTLN